MHATAGLALIALGTESRNGICDTVVHMNILQQIRRQRLQNPLSCLSLDISLKRMPPQSIPDG